jgi:hypothetical protein
MNLSWSTWLPLQGANKNLSIPPLPGLYRIRRVGFDGLDYVGQTGMGGMNLRKRLAMLSGVYGLEMPYRDPHTAAPALWALRQKIGCHYEVSVCPVEGDTPWRKGLECVVIAQYRQEQRCSPTLNFGRMPSGYFMSSGNNRKLVAAGKRLRGGLSEEVLESHIPGIAPPGTLDGSVTALDWYGLDWSQWVPMKNAVIAQGLYRIRRVGSDLLTYIGEGAIKGRLLAHLVKGADDGHRQREMFSEPGTLECSWVAGNWRKHQRLELENDLIAGHVLVTGKITGAQFLG